MAKRFTTAQKKQILDFVEKKGRGALTAAVKKYKVTATSIIAWRKSMAEKSSTAAAEAKTAVKKAAAKTTAKKAAPKSTGFKKSDVRSVFSKIAKHEKEIASLTKKIQTNQNAIAKLRKKIF